ncbi:MBL fold metallo-hydrolase [Paenibacillus sp. FSL P4-0184]|uniref:MBL fold metallo-hydrolase n=1 Tax=Paenibacillus sp. FSL P4-0184 TaxID=2921632 RepID=UPI0030F752C9
MFHSRHFNCEPVAEGIYVLEAKEQGGAMSNAGLIDMGDHTLIFDTFNTPQAGKDLREAALYFFNQPIKYIINSHWHGDHVRGNQHFMEEIIVSTSTTRELMMKTQPDWLNRMKNLLPNLNEDIFKLNTSLDHEHNESKQQELTSELCYLLEIKESILTLKVTLPQLTFDRKMTLHGSKRSVELLTVGAAHTVCDTILYSPSDSIAFVGDIVAVDNHPLLIDGDPLSWLETLTYMESLKVDLIVPGHGPTTSSHYIQQIKQYINDLIGISKQMILDNDVMDVSHIEIPEPYLHWKFDSIFYRNLEFLTKAANR